MCVSLRPLAEAVEKAGAALNLEDCSSGVTAGLRGGEVLASFAKCLREQMCEEKVLLLDWDVGKVFVKSGIISGN